MNKRFGPFWTFLAGGGTIGLFVARHAWVLLLVGFLAGLAAAWAFRAGGRLASRLDRALPDAERGHPCKGPDCNVVVYGRRGYCSETCREVAAEERMRRVKHAERLADYGEVPF